MFANSDYIPVPCSTHNQSLQDSWACISWDNTVNRKYITNLRSRTKAVNNRWRLESQYNKISFILKRVYFNIRIFQLDVHSTFSNVAKIVLRTLMD